jgi:hypothetical protein
MPTNISLVAYLSYTPKNHLIILKAIPAPELEMETTA